MRAGSTTPLPGSYYFYFTGFELTKYVTNYIHISIDGGVCWKPSKSTTFSSSLQLTMAPKPTRNWLELPPELMGNILHRIGVVDILENAQNVCTDWFEICKDPALWRVVYIDMLSCQNEYEEICKNAVDRSQGQMIDLTLIGGCTHELLQYIVDRSSQLKRLEIAYHTSERKGTRSEALMKLPLLEELVFVGTRVSKEDVEVVGRYCPLLKTLKLSRTSLTFHDANGDNEVALAIGRNLPELAHLKFVSNCMINTGLQAILDGCCHLESLDLRGCMLLDLNGDLGKRCSKQIKDLKLPHDKFM